MDRSPFPDKVTRYAATEHDLATYNSAARALSTMRVPRMVSSGQPDDRLFFAYFDGTGNDAGQLNRIKTNIALLHEATRRESRRNPSIASDYVPGPGTQSNSAVAFGDGIKGHTYDERLDTMYVAFCKQAKQWLIENPNARISVAEVGFSRGAEQAAGFARLVAERGIRDPDQMDVRRNGAGLVTSLDWEMSPVLRPGSEVAQAQLLFDPVGTGTPMHRDRRPPPEVITAFQITAEDETRDQFRGSQIWDFGVTHGGRALNVAVGGSHSGVGGGYIEDGLARRSYNLAADYLNALTDRPFIIKRHLRPDLDVVQRSVEHQAVYDEDLFQANVKAGKPDGQRRAHIDVIGGDMKARHAAARDAEPVDRALDARFERHPVRIGPVPETPEAVRDRVPARQRRDLQPDAPRGGMFDRMLDGITQSEIQGDRALARSAFADYAASPAGQALALQVAGFDARQREHVAQLIAAEMAQAPRSHAMRV